MFAAQNGYPKCIQILIKSGADVNTTDKYNRSALMYAVQYRYSQCTDQLIQARACVKTNELDIFGKTTLTTAAENGHWKYLKSLIAAGADVNSMDKFGSTALFYAAGDGHDECVTMLINAGASVNRANNLRKTSLGYTSLLDHGECVKLLLQAGADVNMVSDEYGNTSLIQAARNGSDRCVEILINAGADVNIMNNLNKTGIVYVRGNHYHPLELLAKAGADVNIQCDKQGNVGVIYATMKSEVQLLKALLEAEADVNAVNNEGQSALIMAVKDDLREIRKILLEAGTDVNAGTFEGNTALMLAATKNKMKVVCELLKAGARVNVRNGSRRNATEEYCFFRSHLERKMILILGFAGESMLGPIYNSLGQFVRPVVLNIVLYHIQQTEPKGMNLMSLCRRWIRNRLLELDPHLNLFYRVSQLSLPPIMSKYLMYDISLGDEV